MRALVVGHGSIGARHAEILKGLGLSVSLVSTRQAEGFPCRPLLEAALAEETPDYLVIASPTAEHHVEVATLASLGFRGTLLVEKPLCSAPMELPTHDFAAFKVAYNLRFHPLLLQLRSLLKEERILSVQAYVGQYLPQWRPQRDYRACYSASRLGGGGALRDLSHELDYLGWLFGRWQRVVAIGGRFSSLEIDSDDLFCLMMETERCPAVMLQMNYLDRISQRQMTINTDKRTLQLDLLNGVLRTNDGSERVALERNETYRAMHSALIAGEHEHLCSAAEGLEVVELIAAIEQSSLSAKWVSR